MAEIDLHEKLKEVEGPLWYLLPIGYLNFFLWAVEENSAKLKNFKEIWEASP